MYLIMTEGDLQVEVKDHRIRINGDKWTDIDPRFRYSTIRIDRDNKMFMWRGWVEYEYDWRNNTYTPANIFNKILSLLHFELI